MKKNIITIIALLSVLLIPALVFGSGSSSSQVTIDNGLAADSVNIRDGGNSITMDNAALTVTGNGSAAAGALRVTIADDTTGLLSIDDNGTTISIDDGAGVISVDDAGVTISIDDGGGLVTVNGIVTPTDNFSNPTESINTRNLNSEWDGAAWDRTRHSFSQELTGVVANGAQATVDVTATPMSKYTLVVDRTAGATNVVEINLECSINNTAFITIASITSLVSEPVLVNPAGDVPCLRYRVNVVTVGAGNTLAIDTLATR